MSINFEHNKRLREIADYLVQTGNPSDAEFLCQVACSLHDASVIAAHLGKEKPSTILPGSTTTIGNIAIELKSFMAYQS